MTSASIHPHQSDGETFKYQPLVEQNDIRLLKLDEQSSEYGTREGHITGKLHHVSLGDLSKKCPESRYYAISYFWGDPTPVDKLWLSETQYVSITASAAYVLRRVTREQYIWIDAICINQEDENEKPTQLGCMWNIYKYAEKVLAWPGGADEDDDELAMELLFDIVHASMTEELTDRAPVDLPTSTSDLCSWKNALLWTSSRPPVPPEIQADAKRWRALSRFLDRPWWSRAWVIQELVAAKEVTILVGAGYRNPARKLIKWKFFNAHTDGYYLNWQDLIDILDHLREFNFTHVLEITEDCMPSEQSILPSAVSSARRVEMLRPARQDKRPYFQDNMLATMAAEATNPRDKVFAIASMSQGGMTKELLPNYGMPTKDLYVNVTRHLMVRDQYLMTLHMAGIGWRRKSPGLPSWVPDYSMTRRTGVKNGADFVLGSIARSASFASASPFMSNAPSHVQSIWSKLPLIQVRCVVVDEIEIVCRGLIPSRSIRRSMDSENWIDRKVIRSWLLMVESQMCPNADSKPYVESSTMKTPWNQRRLLEGQAFAAVLIVGSSSEGGPLDFRFDDALGLMYDAFAACVKQDIRPSCIAASTTNRERCNALDAYISALDRIPNWTVFRSKSGYMGRGPPLVKKGDKICVFEGARTPFIIRAGKMPRFAPSTSTIW